MALVLIGSHINIIKFHFCHFIFMLTLNRRCNIYSTMFFSVLTTFLTFLLWYSLFIIAFGLGFFILLHSDDEMNKEEEEKPKFFDHIGLSLVKTFSMFVGELEFSEVPFQVSPRFFSLYLGLVVSQ